MLVHDQKCKNQKCKENGLDKLKVVEVEYIGRMEEEIQNLLDFNDNSESKVAMSSDDSWPAAPLPIILSSSAGKFISRFHHQADSPSSLKSSDGNPIDESSLPGNNIASEYSITKILIISIIFFSIINF